MGDDGHDRLRCVALALACAACTEHGEARERATPAPSLARTVTEPAAPEASTESIAETEADASTAATDANTEGWCTEGFEAIDPATCVLIPDGALASPRSLVIYLHGTIAPTGGTQKVVQSVVAKNARAHGFVALMPRGVRGIGPNKIVDWWAWPTTAAAHAKYGKGMVDGWLDHRAKLETRLGAPFEKTYLAGSSNGAYFLAVLALKGEFPADGFAALSGGSRGMWTKASILATSRPPFYVGYGTYDDTKTGPIALGELLREAAWPHRVAEHRIGHGANEVYLDEAWPFWVGNVPR